MSKSKTAADIRPSVRTIDGVKFIPADWYWNIPTPHGNVIFNFNYLPGVGPSLRKNVKDAFTVLVRANAPERLRRLLSRLRAFFKFLAAEHPDEEIDVLTAAHLENYGASLSVRQQYFLRQLKWILVSWAKTGISGLSLDLLLFLPVMESRSHEVGAAVRTMDPITGPLTDIEYESVLGALRDAFASGRLSLSDYALMVLAIALAPRPAQLALLKIKDLSITRRDDGSKVHILQVTRLKQGKHIRPRTIFRARQLSTAVGGLLEQQIAAVTRWCDCNRIDLAEAPMFPSITRSLPERRPMLHGLAGHQSAKAVGAKISRVLRGLRVFSVRTGAEMVLFQTRIRRTLGSRAAAEGLPATVVADLMDHSWVDSSLVYIESRPEMIERIDKALALKMAPLAHAFTGTLRSRPHLDSGGGKKTIHIESPDSLRAVGICGKLDFCGLAAPLACYTCSFFNPWLDDNHETLLDRLLTERETMLAMCDARIASVNDRTILAIADVVNRCRDSAIKGSA
ncbi:site-specific integrase [Paraburkholderia sp. EG304]|uniref:site-specific integrase n=1 Tax=Paraburkholderia sp. EG304 TaxID=3237015 RepID=UPI00397A7DFB